MVRIYVMCIRMITGILHAILYKINVHIEYCHNRPIAITQHKCTCIITLIYHTTLIYQTAAFSVT